MEHRPVLTFEPAWRTPPGVRAPLLAALQEIDALRQLVVFGTRCLGVGEFLDSRAALVAALGATRAAIDDLVVCGHLRPLDGELAFDVATLPELERTDPLEPNVEGALRRLGRLVEPF
jgi:hypothetical protein